MSHVGSMEKNSWPKKEPVAKSVSRRMPGWMAKSPEG